MAKGGGAREGGALKTAVIVAGGLALAWVTVETAFRPFLDRLRSAVARKTDPDQEEAPASAAAEAEEEKAPAPEEPSAPPAPAVVEEKVEEKVAELEEKVEEVTAAAADDKAE